MTNLDIQNFLKRSVTLRDAMFQARMNTVSLNRETGISRQIISDCAERFQDHNQLRTLRKLVDGLPGFELVIAIIPTESQGGGQ